MSIEKFDHFGEVKVFSKREKFFHMVITKGFSDKNSLNVMKLLISEGIVDEYPIVEVNVTERDFYDILLIKP